MRGVYLQINSKMRCKNSQKHRNDRNWPFFVKNIQLGKHAYTLILQAKTREEMSFISNLTTQTHYYEYKCHYNKYGQFAYTY